MRFQRSSLQNVIKKNIRKKNSFLRFTTRCRCRLKVCRAVSLSDTRRAPLLRLFACFRIKLKHRVKESIRSCAVPVQYRCRRRRLVLCWRRHRGNVLFFFTLALFSSVALMRAHGATAPMSVSISSAPLLLSLLLFLRPSTCPPPGRSSSASRWLCTRFYPSAPRPGCRRIFSDHPR